MEMDSSKWYEWKRSFPLDVLIETKHEMAHIGHLL